MQSDVLTEELHGITVEVVFISSYDEEIYCSVCGDRITTKDVSCIWVLIPVSQKSEYMHDTTNCFERYAVSLAYFYNHRPTMFEDSNRIQ